LFWLVINESRGARVVERQPFFIVQGGGDVQRAELPNVASHGMVDCNTYAKQYPSGENLAFCW